MLSDEERTEIEHEATRYPTRQALTIEALKIVQRHRGWISDQALDDVAVYLEVSRAELEGIATFYNLLFRRPVGRHVVLLCDSVSCWILGYDRVREALIEQGLRMGATSADGRFTLLPVPCLGACDRAPALHIDDDLHGNVDPDRVAALLEGYR
ncbi:MAG TPA: NADH-quinone oxidoreductase subunit NuoE [Burkholderiales bacterium]|nr:NADH-quinone oxidoreductase subunit NuoE [Burkholderiales bacterium]